jgi:hypothetical protein
MFKAWCKEQRTQYICKSQSVSRSTVDKYRRKDNWDARLDKIRTKAREKLDDDEAKNTAHKLKVLKNVETVYLTCLIGKTECPHCHKQVPVPKLKPNFKDITEIYKVDELLRGKPDSRPDIGRVLEQMPDEDLLALWERSCTDIVERLQKIRAMVKGKRVLAAINELIEEVNG